ncbi:tyrosine-type recombinase/integrase [Escherichia coli]|uniref:tyrosine-type recombinase/integrase n=1 Tax=Escherichia coli TaxID=562 RepID=UPI00351D65C8|nr:hypothetical protein [Escherichia coli]
MINRELENIITVWICACFAYKRVRKPCAPPTSPPECARSLFSTWANENGENSDVIERCLAHVHGNAVRAAYNHAMYLTERRDLLQRWADLLLPEETAQGAAEAA